MSHDGRAILILVTLAQARDVSDSLIHVAAPIFNLGRFLAAWVVAT